MGSNTQLQTHPGPSGLNVGFHFFRTNPDERDQIFHKGPGQMVDSRAISVARDSFLQTIAHSGLAFEIDSHTTGSLASLYRFSSSRLGRIRCIFQTPHQTGLDSIVEPVEAQALCLYCLPWSMSLFLIWFVD